MTTKQPLKKSSLLRRCRHWKRPSDARLPFTYLAGSVGFGFNIRLSTAIGHLHRGAALTGIGAFLVRAANVTSSVAN